MAPGVRKLALTVHLTTTLGWLGAVLVFAALAVIGLTSQQAQTVRGVYLVMEPAAWLVLLPLAFASLVTGLIQALGTSWGLLRHYWILFKLVMAVFITVVLLIYMETFRSMADVAADPGVGIAAVRNASPLIHALLASLVLLVATVLAVYKPQGITSRLEEAASRRAPRWVRVFGIIVVAVIVVFVMLLFGKDHGPGRHMRAALHLVTMENRST